MSDLYVRAFEPSDWEAVSKIYEEGILTRLATFVEEVPSYEDWHQSHLEHSRLVAVDPKNHKIMGFGVLSPTSSRCVYRGVAEVSLYVAEASRGQGVGTLLLNALIASSEANGIWTLHSGIISKNTASLKLHAACGFRLIGYRERIGHMKDLGWLDVSLMERRRLED